MCYPALEIFLQGVKSRAGASLMASVVLILAFACSVGTYATASRMLWSFSRDKAVPFHRQLARLTANTVLPVTAVLTTLVVTILLSLIVLGSSVALNDVLSLSIAALFSTYILISALLLWRRLTGGIRKEQDDVTDVKSIFGGPWRIPELWGSINNLFALMYLSSFGSGPFGP